MKQRELPLPLNHEEVIAHLTHLIDYFGDDTLHNQALRQAVKLLSHQRNIPVKAVEVIK